MGRRASICMQSHGNLEHFGNILGIYRTSLESTEHPGNLQNILGIWEPVIWEFIIFNI